jgi:hypothetical protein
MSLISYGLGRWWHLGYVESDGGMVGRTARKPWMVGWLVELQCVRVYRGIFCVLAEISRELTLGHPLFSSGARDSGEQNACSSLNWHIKWHKLC